jgi:hypothetical protein
MDSSYLLCVVYKVHDITTKLDDQLTPLPLLRIFTCQHSCYMWSGISCLCHDFLSTFQPPCHNRGVTMATMMDAPVSVTSTPSGGSRLAQMQVSTFCFPLQYKAVLSLYSFSYFVEIIVRTFEYQVTTDNKSKEMILSLWISYLKRYDFGTNSSKLMRKCKSHLEIISKTVAIFLNPYNHEAHLNNI